jgi:FAD/FMN-containing dehydrogenase
MVKIGSAIGLWAVIALASPQAAQATAVVNDVTQINPIIVDRVITPTTVEEIQKAVSAHKGKISIGGGRYSMGGQTATEGALQIDLRKFNQVVKLDVQNKRIIVQAGIRWRDIQDVIDPVNLSIKIMQTYSNFTVGGSLSVNVHGRYIGQGPLIRSVAGLKVVLADGTLVEATPSQNPEIFYGVIGGYGALGVIVEATLELTDNEKVERQAKVVPAREYVDFFMKEIRDNPKVVFHNGDLYPPEFESVAAVSWLKTDKPLTVQERLIPRNQKYVFQPRAISMLTTLPGGRKLRSSVIDPLLYKNEMVVWRNHEASYDVAELEPPSRRDSTFVLQEYFVPVKRFDEFVPKMRDVFRKHNVQVFNVSIRHALPDPGSLLAWARQEVFAFVVYYRQGTTPADRIEVGNWTRELISQVLTVDGTYYLPYQIHATDEQFHRAYPLHNEFFALKKRLDPEYKFRNKLWDRYYHSMPDSIATALNGMTEYKRGEEQSFLSLPEWYIVFNGDEYAAFLKTNKPSAFPYWQSAAEFWRLKGRVKELIRDQYPPNFGYNAMLWVIGTSYSAELVLKGFYENTIGRLTESFMDDSGTDEDRIIQRFHQEYADFVHVYPWYEFKFWDRLKRFWAETPLTGDFFVRKWERKLAFSTEYLVKTAYGWLIGLGTRASYSAEPTEIFAVVNDPERVIASQPGVRVINESDTYQLVGVPRYDKFRDLALSLVGRSTRFVEIAGNRKIFLTAIASVSTPAQLESGEVSGESLVPSDPSLRRWLITCPVGALTEVLAQLKAKSALVEHIFDY